MELCTASAKITKLSCIVVCGRLLMSSSIWLTFFCTERQYWSRSLCLFLRQRMIPFNPKKSILKGDKHRKKQLKFKFWTEKSMMMRLIWKKNAKKKKLRWSGIKNIHISSSFDVNFLICVSFWFDAQDRFANSFLFIFDRTPARLWHERIRWMRNKWKWWATWWWTHKTHDKHRQKHIWRVHRIKIAEKWR